ncbi:MAG: histidine kinase [Acidobacteria bacterium]|nr:histidine kinase [Acidobacteriota bacterium]
MFQSLDVHEPLLVNSVGHAIGFLLFAGLLVLVLHDKRRGESGPSNLLPITASLALLWNAGSLVVLAATSGLLPASDFVPSASFAVLSLIPAALLELSLNGQGRLICLAGWILSACAAVLHLVELLSPDMRFHQLALWLIIAGFGCLTLIAMITVRRPAGTRLDRSRIPVSMSLFLFAISFAHFNPQYARSAWSGEIAFHHAGIPLALYVLLQDYRFLLLDAFMRFLANSVVAAGFIALAVGLDSRFRLLEHAGQNPFVQGMLLVTAGLLIVLVVIVRGKLQVLLTRVVFRRQDPGPAVQAIRNAGNTGKSEREFLELSAATLAAFVQAGRHEVRLIKAWNEKELASEPIVLADSNHQKDRFGFAHPWVEALIPARFLKGDGACILLGRREGGKRYLSEDLQELSRLAAVVVEQVERLRSSEMQRLASQAELRALQSQINPHFLFNSLNTLYGTIPRSAAEARGLVMDLAEIFRYFLQSDRTFIPLSEELEIVRAYLQVEKLRLGDRLHTDIVVEPAAGQAMIPILSVQPLVENAVKHGVAARSGTGTVQLHARVVESGVLIEVSDDGCGFAPLGRKSAGAGIGLDNVRQRLKLCYGESADLQIASSERGTTVAFWIGANHAFREICRELSA